MQLGWPGSRDSCQLASRQQRAPWTQLWEVAEESEGRVLNQSLLKPGSVQSCLANTFLCWERAQRVADFKSREKKKKVNFELEVGRGSASCSQSPMQPVEDALQSRRTED